MLPCFLAGRASRLVASWARPPKLTLYAIWAKQENVSYVDENGSMYTHSAHLIDEHVIFLNDGSKHIGDI